MEYEEFCEELYEILKMELGVGDAEDIEVFKKSELLKKLYRELVMSNN